MYVVEKLKLSPSALERPKLKREKKPFVIPTNELIDKS